ncbi:MAG: LXG domain-containing protein, partial [Propionibacteriaceae bacterium]|nr:LXG domain-containing protein [Propionibacteriaceae bacterium]
MGFSVDYDELTTLGFSVQTKLGGWGEQLTAIQGAMDALVGLESFQGSGAQAVKTYVSEVHAVIIASFGEILAELGARFLLFKDGYHLIDTDLHAKLSEDTLKELTRFHTDSRDQFQDIHTRIQSIANQISDLIGLDVPSAYSVTDRYDTTLRDLNTVTDQV